MEEEKKDDICCPPINQEEWNGKELNWENKKFVTDKTINLFHIPLNMGSVITKVIEKIKKVDAFSEPFMILSDCDSPWKSILHFTVNKEVPETESATISGKFLTKAFEGEYKDSGKWVKEMEEYVKEKGYSSDKIYFWYTTCPKCAKKQGKNITILLAKIG